MLDDLALVTHELGALPAPSMPSDVAARIDAALMAEASSVTVSRETVRPQTRRWRWPQLALAAAAALVAVGLAGILLRSVDMTATDAGGGGVAADSGQAENGTSSDPLEAPVRELLAGELDLTRLEGDDESYSPSDASGDGTEEELSVSVPGCVRDAIDRSGRPLAAARERFEGQDAYLVVFSHPTRSDHVDAFAVAAACVDASDENPGDLLAQGSYRLNDQQ
ncbi:hypothetical protein ACTWP5_01995 [Streptomyces sp. 4N509B]|uniref:hypothetical protein n=1 Tax=Streptomyces sp. 4N509B TaxID=3457413 RepID=UPI003FD2522F